MALLNRLLANSRSLCGRNIAPLNTGEGAKRYKHVVAAPPRNPMSTGESFVYFILMGVGMWSVPCWIFYHIPDYQKEDRHKYTGQM